LRPVLRDLDQLRLRGLKLTAELMPDMTAVGCAFGCGSGTYLQRETIVLSSELAGLTTSPLTASAASYAPPLAWFDQAAGSRVGDKCYPLTSAISVNGHGYTVERLWSNAAQGCVSSTSKLVVVPSADVNGGGSISPSLPQAVDAADPPVTLAFTVTPDPALL
jgi:hypothetical protein